MADRHNIAILAAAFMGNHLHIVADFPGPIEASVTGYLRTHAWKFNRRHSRIGHLFGGPFRSRVCRDAEQVRRFVAYAALNPCKHGIVKDPGAYRWTSHLDVLGDRRPLFPIARDRVLELFAPFDPDPIRGYLSYLAKWPATYDGSFDLKIDEAERVPKSRNAPPMTSVPVRPVVEPTTPTAAPFQSLAEISKSVSLRTGVSLQDIQSPSRLLSAVRARDLLCLAACTHNGHPQIEVARWIEKDPATVWKSIERARRLGLPVIA